MLRAFVRPARFWLLLGSLAPLLTGGFGMATARQATPSEADLEALVRAFYEPFNTGDVAVYERVLAPDWADHPLAPGQRPGRAGFAPVIVAFRSAFPDLQVVNEEILVDGDRVAVRSTMRGTQTGPLFGIPATGRPIEAMAIDIHRIEGGQIVETWHVEDWLSVFGQLGVQFGPAANEPATPVP